MYKNTCPSKMGHSLSWEADTLRVLGAEVRGEASTGHGGAGLPGLNVLGTAAREASSRDAV